MIPTTIPEYVEDGKLQEYSHRTLNSELSIYNTSTNHTITVPYNAIVSKYRDYFDKYIISIELNEDEKRRYWHNPKIVSYDKYGTVEYWSIILFINECGSALDFEPEFINIIDTGDLERLISDLLILDRDIL